LEYIDLGNSILLREEQPELSTLSKDEFQQAYQEKLKAGFKEIIQILKLNPQLEFGPNLTDILKTAEQEHSLNSNIMAEFNKSGMKLRAMTQPQFTGNIMLKSQGEKKLHDCKFRFV
jgi:hypothetical protein